MMGPENINWLAVIGATLSCFFIGGIWYGPLFGKAWMDAFGFTEDDLKKRNMPLVFGVAFTLSLIAAVNLEMFIGWGDHVSTSFGFFAGFAAGLGWVAAFIGIIYLFEMRSMKAFLINGGYCVVAMSVMGIILGTW